MKDGADAENTLRNLESQGGASLSTLARHRFKWRAAICKQFPDDPPELLSSACKPLCGVNGARRAQCLLAGGSRRLRIEVGGLPAAHRARPTSSTCVGNRQRSCDQRTPQHQHAPPPSIEEPPWPTISIPTCHPAAGRNSADESFTPGRRSAMTASARRRVLGQRDVREQ